MQAQTSNPARALRIRKQWALDGPNAWTDRRAIRVTLDCGAVSGDVQSRIDALMQGFRPDASSERSTPRNAGEMLAMLIIDLQQMAGENVGFWSVSPGARSGDFDVVCECTRISTGSATAAVALRILNHVAFGTEPDFDFGKVFDYRLMRHIRFRRMGFHREAVIQAAERLGFNVRIVDEHDQLVQIGTGAQMQHYLGTLTMLTRETASRIARRKPLTIKLLREHGIPTPNGVVVSTAEGAVDAAARIGYPVVVKPVNLRQGRAVSADLRDAAAVRVAAERALTAGGSARALVEPFIPGRDYRVLVHGDEVIAVAERIPAAVTGDGQHSVEELIAEVNAGPLRGQGYTNLLVAITIDNHTHEALARQGLTISSVPEAGRHVPVKLICNASVGGTTSDFSDHIHPENARIAVMAARVVGLDIAGVDIRTEDISVPLRESGGVVLEINSEPNYDMHLYAENAEGRDIGGPLMRLLFPQGPPGQPVVVTMTSAPQSPTIAAMIERLIRGAGLRTGMSTRTGVSFGGEPFGMAPDRHSPGLNRVMFNTLTEAAILEIGHPEIEQMGLPFRKIDVALLIAGADDEPGSGLRGAASLLVSLANGGGTVISHAGDPRFAAERRRDPGRWILLSSDEAHCELVDHLARGGRAVVHRQSEVVLHRGEQIDVVGSLKHDGLHEGGLLEGVLATVATGAALGIDMLLIRQALASDIAGEITG